MRCSAAMTPAASQPALPPPTITILEIVFSMIRLVSHVMPETGSGHIGRHGIPLEWPHHHRHLMEEKSLFYISK